MTPLEFVVRVGTDGIGEAHGRRAGLLAPSDIDLQILESGGRRFHKTTLRSVSSVASASSLDISLASTAVLRRPCEDCVGCPGDKRFKAAHASASSLAKTIPLLTATATQLAAASPSFQVNPSLSACLSDVSYRGLVGHEIACIIRQYYITIQSLLLRLAAVP